jgi:hypothetical protein
VARRANPAHGGVNESRIEDVRSYVVIFRNQAIEVVLLRHFHTFARGHYGRWLSVSDSPRLPVMCRSGEGHDRRAGMRASSISPVVVPLGTVEPSTLQAALLESGVPIRTGRGRYDLASRMNSLLP